MIFLEHPAEWLNLFGAILLSLAIIRFAVVMWKFPRFETAGLLALMLICLLPILGARMVFYVGRIFFDFTREFHGTYLVSWPTILLWPLMAGLVVVGSMAVRQFHPIVDELSQAKRQNAVLYSKLKGLGKVE